MIFSSLLKRERAILFLVLGIIAAIFVYNFVFEPLVNKWKDLDTQISAKNIKLRKYVRLISIAQYYNQEYNRYATQSEGAKSNDEHFAAILSFVESASRKTNVYINSLKPGSVKEEKFHKIFLIEAEAEASVKNLMVFLYEIENSLMMLKVKSLNINSKSGQDDGVKARIVISKVLF